MFKKKILIAFLVLLFPWVAMAKVEQTLSIVKPDAIQKQKLGIILSEIQEKGMKIVAGKMIDLTRRQAADFYKEHKGKAFYFDLVEFMSSGPVFVQVLEGENAVKNYRQLMGHTDPAQAAPNTLRARYGVSITQNAVHGSDDPASARREIRYFFSESELIADE